MAGRAGTSLARFAAVVAGVVVLATAWSGAALAEDDTTTPTTTTTTTSAPTGNCSALSRQLTALLAQFQALSSRLGNLGEVGADNPVTAQLAALQSRIDALSAQVDATCAPTRTTTSSGALPAGNGTQPAGATDRDCRDFASQQDAQQYFTSIGGSSAVNADRLDADHDGVACEDYDYGALASADTAQVATVPVGGIDTGDGSFAR